MDNILCALFTMDISGLEQDEKTIIQSKICFMESESLQEKTNKDLRSISDTILHTIFNSTLQKYFRQIIGNYYVWIHLFIMTLGVYIILFSMNPYSLIFMINILAIDAFTIVILHDCPLTMLERYYIKNSSVYWRLKTLRNCGIKYTLENEYDIQLEVVINAAALAIFKLFFITIFNSKPFI